MRGFIAVGVAIVLIGCVANTPAPQQPSSLTGEKWSTGCQPDQKDPYGKLIERSKCWAMVTSFGQSDEGVAIGVATLFEVDHKGPRLTSNPDLDRDLCDEKPVRMAVDGKRIDQLPMPQRIEAVLSGNRFTREKDRGWPHCNVYNETTTVKGARVAYNEMMTKWQSHK
ncbi:hypothetical protein RI570_11490 [Brucella pseudogrignonensis]|uniref:hypothetical protein n=1 Tax=Brucella pseudogrignonensis TaxID=419475 RepID=UPI0028B7AC7D|nr:hypothetical protein [Brucella pseudogrignonensis]MDT6940771.1 hypothetical protein [Brucella pseudogrignonensis]